MQRINIHTVAFALNKMSFNSPALVLFVCPRVPGMRLILKKIHLIISSIYFNIKGLDPFLVLLPVFVFA